MEAIAKMMVLGCACLVLLLVGRIGACTVEAIETRSGHFPIISLSTIQTKAELALAMHEFVQACLGSQEAEAWFYRLTDCESSSERTDSCDAERQEAGAALEEDLQAMEAAVERRKALARELGYGWVKSVLIGTSAYTHATWHCLGPYASSNYAVTAGFTRTY